MHEGAACATCCGVIVEILLLGATFLGGCASGDIKWALIGYLITINIITFITFAIDKCLAAMDDGEFRAPEISLYFFVFCGGFIGGILSMIFCHHKTNKGPFVTCMVALLVFNLGWVFVGLIVAPTEELKQCKHLKTEINNTFHNLGEKFEEFGNKVKKIDEKFEEFGNKLKKFNNAANYVLSGGERNKTGTK